MARHFNDFIAAYEDYAIDGYVPDSFHRWTAIAIVAAALERKVWLRHTNTPNSSFLHYPNLLTLLVSHPAIGKTSAMDKGVKFLEMIRENADPEFKIIPNKCTDAALVELMKIRKAISAGTVHTFHSSGFFYASEASASALCDAHDAFTASVCELYDCLPWFRKAVKMDKEQINISNVCLNVFAGCTFDFLKTLVNEESVMGGLASRFLYVIEKDRKISTTSFLDESELVPSTAINSVEKKLYEDLLQIHNLVGGCKPEKPYRLLWEEENTRTSEFLAGLNSERMSSLYGRRMKHVTKLSMILSVAESDSLILRERHLEEAIKMVDEVTKNNPMVINTAIVANVNTQAGLTQFILNKLNDNRGNMRFSDLKSAILDHGTDILRVEQTLKFMDEAGKIKITSDNSGSWVDLLVDPNAGL